jgi:hypothetical protein
MSVSKINPKKFLDGLMKDGKWRSERQMVAALAEAYRLQAAEDVKAWFKVWISKEGIENGLRDKITVRWPNNVEQRWVYWRILPPDQRPPECPFPDRTYEEALQVVRDEAMAERERLKRRDEERFLKQRGL